MVSFRKKKSTKSPATSPKDGGDAGTGAPSPSAPPGGDGGGAPADEAREPEASKTALPSRPPQMEDIPDLLRTMTAETGEKSAAATKRLYELCDVGHKQNRVPMVCGGQHDVLTPLAACLTQESGDGRHLACLALNNLSIPTENKRAMALGPASAAVIGGLCQVIAEDKQELYLCCICLMNLSFLEASVVAMLRHSPAAAGEEEEGAAPKDPLDNPASLLRILEKLLVHAPAVPKQGSGKSEGVRWACGLIKNLAKAEENAALFGQTEVPRCVVGNLRSAAAPPGRWTSNSLEDFSLFVALNLAQCDEAKEALLAAGAIDVIRPLMAEGDLQGLKATMTCAFLGAPWDAFPDGGLPAARAVAELMTNVTEKKGKDGQYAYGVFKLHAATRAYRDLAAAARDADDRDGGHARAAVLAQPAAVALCLRVVSDLVLAADDEKGGSKYVPDVRSAEHAAGALARLLPAVLAPGEPARPTKDGTCVEVATLLTRYADLAGTSPAGREVALQAAEEVREAGGTVRPALDAAHEQWTQYRRREGQPLDQFLVKEQGVEVDESGPLDFLPCVNSESQCVIF